MLPLLFLVITNPGQNVWLAGLVLPNLLPESKVRPLEWVSRGPKVLAVEIPYNDQVIKADLYLPKKFDKVILTIHGANEKGKEDPRIINFGQTFARMGIAALIPTFPNITREKFTPGAVAEIRTAYKWLIKELPNNPAGLIAFSVAAGPMFIAAADDEINERINYLISFGGYHELKEVLRNITTGTDRDPFGLELIAGQYRKFFGPDESLDHLLDNTDPEKFEALFVALPPEIKKFIDGLTPADHLSNIKAEKIFLVHSDPDRIIPISESEKLHQTLGKRSELTILKSFSHVNIQLAKPTPANILKFYVPEAWKLYRLGFRIINY